MSRALIVDDKRLGLRAMSNELVDAGFDVMLAIDGYEALRKFREADPSVVVSDFQMPEMDGIELLRRVREFSNVPFILITAYGSVQLRERAIACGAQHALDFGDDLARLGALANLVVTNHSAHVSKDQSDRSREVAKARQRVFRRAELEQTLLDCNWNISEAARQLNISRSGLRYQLKQLGMSS